jgi:hypothetical protein
MCGRVSGVQTSACPWEVPIIFSDTGSSNFPDIGALLLHWCRVSAAFPPSAEFPIFTGRHSSVLWLCTEKAEAFPEGKEGVAGEEEIRAFVHFLFPFYHVLAVICAFLLGIL